jgi:hypothetical protein
MTIPPYSRKGLRLCLRTAWAGISLVLSLCGLQTSVLLQSVLTTARSNCSIKGIRILLLE